jgi:signal transduction histidine kinase
MVNNEIRNIVLLTTAIFLIAPVFVVLYIFIYNQRKKRHAEEKRDMQRLFNEEIEKTQLEVQEQTMQTIGADLHDNIGQLLSLASLTLGAIELEGLPEEQGRIDAAIELTGRSINELRVLGRLIQGSLLLERGLYQAILQEVSWIERSGRLGVTLIVDDQQQYDGNRDKELIIFRIIQETINNILKHANATKMEINFCCVNGVLQLTMADNGKGFPPKESQQPIPGMGLFNMKKRINLAGGNLEIESYPDMGSAIKIYIPYP